MRLGFRLMLATVLGSTTPAWAYNSVAGVRDGQTRFTGGLLLQDAEYEFETGNTEFDVEGDIVTLGVKSGLSSSFALGAGLGLMLDGELGRQGTVGDGEGYRLFVDGDLEFTRLGGSTLLGTFILTHDRFSFDDPGDVDFTMTEIKAGVLVLRRIQHVSLYGGLDVILFSDGEVDDGRPDPLEAERSSRLNLRLGLAFAVNSSIDLRADLHLLNEQSLFFGADFRI
jgi:hypothetical protein